MSVPGFLDTSFIVRYLTGDPLEMADRAARVIDSGESLILSELALVEAAYVLTSYYQMSRPDLVDVLMDLVQRRNIQLATLPKARVLEALLLCRDSKRHSFTDVMLWAQAREHGMERIYSFDRRFPSEGVTIIGMK